MAKTKQKRSKYTPSPLRIAAEQSLTPQARQQAGFMVCQFQERGLDGGVLDGMRLEKISCVRALEGLVRKHPKAKRAFLDPIHLMAANAYHADLIAISGQRSHVIREAIDVSSDAEAALLYRLEARSKLFQIQSKMPAEQKSLLDQIMIDFPDATLVSIWPNRTQRDRAKDKIKSALDLLAVEYGLVSSNL